MVYDKCLFPDGKRVLDRDECGFGVCIKVFSFQRDDGGGEVEELAFELEDFVVQRSRWRQWWWWR